MPSTRWSKKFHSRRFRKTAIENSPRLLGWNVGLRSESPLTMQFLDRKQHSPKSQPTSPRRKSVESSRGKKKPPRAAKQKLFSTISANAGIFACDELCCRSSYLFVVVSSSSFHRCGDECALDERLRLFAFSCVNKISFNQFFLLFVCPDRRSSISSGGNKFECNASNNFVSFCRRTKNVLTGLDVAFVPRHNNQQQFRGVAKSPAQERRAVQQTPPI